MGTGKADEIAEQVRRGEISVQTAINIGDQQEALYNESRGRKDIDPENWNAFEDGWRPE